MTEDAEQENRCRRWHLGQGDIGPRPRRHPENRKIKELWEPPQEVTARFGLGPAQRLTVVLDRKMPSILRLEFFFDHESRLLAKIAHMGHDPGILRIPSQPARNRARSDKQVFWEHYFSDYRETDGIKQWRMLEVDNDGRRFAAINVGRVEFFDEMRPELRRPEQ